MSNWFLIIVEISWTQIVFVEKKNKQTLSPDEKKLTMYKILEDICFETDSILSNYMLWKSR